MNDEYVESKCNECNTALVQLDGDWCCPDCSSGDTFQLVPDQDSFEL